MTVRDSRCTGRVQGRRPVVACRWCGETFPVWMRGDRGRVSWQRVLAAHVRRLHAMHADALNVRSPEQMRAAP